MTDLYDLPYRNEIKRRDNRMKKFWIIFVEHTDGGRHYRHPSLESAEKESERLARLPDNQGKAVYLFECIGICKTEQPLVKWEIPKWQKEEGGFISPSSVIHRQIKSSLPEF